MSTLTIFSIIALCQIFSCVVLLTPLLFFFFSGLFQIGVSVVFILAWFIMYKWQMFGHWSETLLHHIMFYWSLILRNIHGYFINATYFPCAFGIKYNLFIQCTKSAFDLNKGGQSVQRLRLKCAMTIWSISKLFFDALLEFDIVL